MARKYKFHDNSKLYFVTFTVVNWIDAFIRKDYRKVFYESVAYCQQNKGLEVYGYCIMTSHIHMIIGTEKGNLSDIVNHPIELDTHFKAIQRLNYIHQNPVVMGFGEKAEE